MKICMLSIADCEQPYGSTARPYSIGKHLARHGAKLIHVCEKLPEDGPGVTIISRRDQKGISGAEQARRVRDLCRTFSPDLIYSHQVHSARMGMWLSRCLKKPHVYDAHSSLALESSTFASLPLRERFLGSAYETYLAWRSDKVIVPSAELGDYFIRRHRLRPDRIRIVKNGAETDTFKPAGPDLSLRERLGVPPAALLIACTNPRLATFPSNEMALGSLFRMVPEIERRIPGVRFVILGGGPEPRPPSSSVIYSGFVQDLPAHLNLADICIAPYPPEAVCGGTRDKICDYLACGKPIVATREAMRGFDDAVPGVHYALAENEPDFIAKLVEFARDPEFARELGRNARRLAERYDWSLLALKVMDVFKEVRAAGHGEDGR